MKFGFIPLQSTKQMFFLSLSIPAILYAIMLELFLFSVLLFGPLHRILPPPPTDSSKNYVKWGKPEENDCRGAVNKWKNGWLYLPLDDGGGGG